MARMIFTNNKAKFDRAFERNVNAGFDDYVQHKANNYFLAAHKKRRQKIENFIEKAGGDFCCIAGTCIYKSTIGQKALNQIYNDFENDVESIREAAIGNYLIAIKKNNSIVVFVDKYQILKVYHFNIGNDWFITNSLADVGYVLDELNLHEFAFMQETMLVGAVGEQSIFKDVFRLFGHQYIEIDSLNNSFTIKEIPYSRKRISFEGRTIESAVSEYAEIVKSKFAIVANLWGDNVRIHQTGGLDNRTVFSAFMSVGCKPKIMYGTGNSILTNTKNEDLLICREYQKKFSLDFYKMDWTENYLDCYHFWPALFDRYGFNFHIYGGSRNFFKEYEGQIPEYPEFMECGYFLENLRLRAWAYNSRKTTFTLDDFIDRYLLGGAYGNFTANKLFYKRYSVFKEYTKNIIREYLKLYQIGEENKISLDDFDQTRWIHARNADSIMVNFLNEFAPSIAMFSLPELHEFPFDVPASWRANGMFQLMLIHNLYPQTLDIPIFSHSTKNRFEKNTFTLVEENKPLEFIRLKLKRLGVPETVLKKIGRFYRRASLDSTITATLAETKKLQEYIISIINENGEDEENFVNSKSYEGNIVFLMIYAQYLYGVQSLRQSNTQPN